MKDFDKMTNHLEQQLSQLLSDEILEINKVGEGYLSIGYKIVGKQKSYFMREIKPNVPGFEYPLDQVKCFVTSHLMVNNAAFHKSYGVLSFEGKNYHITDFVEGRLLNISETNEDNLSKICDKIAQLHTRGKDIVQQFDEDQKKRYYRRSLREVITNNETLFWIFENLILDTDEKLFFEKLIKKMFDVYLDISLKGNPNRLTCLHGDFWHGNIMIDSQSDIHFIDFSRIPYGEAGIDIGRFVSQFDVEQLIGNIDNAQKIKDFFLQRYISKTGDEDIMDYIKLTSLRVGFVHLCPMVQQFFHRNQHQKDAVKRYMLEL